jgi:hypothetical protein
MLHIRRRTPPQPSTQRILHALQCTSVRHSATGLRAVLDSPCSTCLHLGHATWVMCHAVDGWMDATRACDVQPPQGPAHARAVSPGCSAPRVRRRRGHSGPSGRVTQVYVAAPHHSRLSTPANNPANNPALHGSTLSTSTPTHGSTLDLYSWRQDHPPQQLPRLSLTAPVPAASWLGSPRPLCLGSSQGLPRPPCSCRLG